MTYEEKEESMVKLEEAQEKIHEAIMLIREALKNTRKKDEAEAYIIAHLKNWADGGNPYDYTSIPKLLEFFEKQ